MTKSKKFRLVTRSDFDGLVCAILLKELDMIEDILFVQPKDMQDGRIPIGGNDILANVPVVDGCHLCFDHHDSESLRLNGAFPENYIFDAEAESTARLIYEYYGGPEVFVDISAEMMAAVDKSDTARFTRSEVLNPSGWVLLSIIMDSRTGLGRFKNFRISNYQLMVSLIAWCRSRSISEVLELPDVKERVELYFDHEERCKSQIQRCAQLHDNLVVLDFRDEDPIFAGNRFLVYALYPNCSVSMHIIWGLKRRNTVFALGKSILNPTSTINIGRLALQYGGGGHAGAGTCQIPNPQAETVRSQLITRITTWEVLYPRAPQPTNAGTSYGEIRDAGI